MKQVFNIMGAVALVAMSGITSAAELTVTVTNIQKHEGTLYIRIYDTTSKWLSQEKQDVRASQVIALADVKNIQSISATFDLPVGKYAATVVQDVNSNGKLDKNWMGKPTEPSGNTSRGDENGPPVFEDSTFEITGDTQKSITLVSY